MSAPRRPIGEGPLRTGPRVIGEPVRTPWDRSAGAPPAPTALNDLADVVAPREVEGVLRRDADGFVRPVALPDVTVEWFEGEGPPPDVVPGAGRGDFYMDVLTGALYRLT